MKYYHIKDEETGRDYMVEEVEATPVDEDLDNPSDEEVHDDEEISLTPEEISALKGLAAAAPKLMALIQTQDSDEEEEDGEEEMRDEDEDEEEVHDEDEDEEVNEEVVDTDEEKGKKTAKDSFGSTIKSKKTKDSIESREQAINEAWAKVYGGIK